MPSGALLYSFAVYAVKDLFAQEHARGDHDEETKKTKKNSKEVLEGHLADHFGMITPSFMSAKALAARS